jgi:adsorption protein B
MIFEKIYFFSLCTGFLLFGLDDIFIDAVAWLKRLGPKELKVDELRSLNQRPEKRIAIMLAAWKEEDVIAPMVRGNIQQIQYDNYDFFLGVYPNDLGTLREAEQLAQEFENIHVIINSKTGPTSKGQMLNEIARKIVGSGKYDILLMHDAEDIIHPLSLKLINWRCLHSDFVQVPVFSLPTSQTELVAGLYIDEFAESHTKDLLVRQALGAPVPSAGVGTAMTMRYVHRMMKLQNGNLFNPGTVTEDYQLGLRGPEVKLKTEFACYHYMEKDHRNYIATHEYFPKSFSAAIRQRSRWTLGIAYQGFADLGWRGNLVQKYFLYRDRKGPLANMLTILGFSLLFVDPKLHDLFWMAPFMIVFALNRIFQRVYHTANIYGMRTTMMTIPRMILGNIINAAAAVRATYQHSKYLVSGKKPAWLKTTHELPIGFGRPSAKVTTLRVAKALALIFLVGLLSPSASFASDQKLACIYYDNIDGYPALEVNPVMLKNLFGHFRDIRTEIRGVKDYQTGGMSSCEFIAYMGLVFDAPVGLPFLHDLYLSQKPILWIGSNIWQLEKHLGRDSFRTKYGFNYVKTAGYDTNPRMLSTWPDFYRTIAYKGEFFNKWLTHNANGFLADPEIYVTKADGAQVLAKAIHTSSKDQIPYVLRKGNFFFVADKGFSYMHENDRYLVLADILFDFLNEAPEPGKKKAFVRLEDIDPTYPVEVFLNSVKVLTARKIAFGVATIPKFIGSRSGEMAGQQMTLLESPRMMLALRYVQENRGQILMHGFTHQVSNLPGCPTEDTGDGFEFWDHCQNRPVPWDSEEWAQDRLKQGLEILSNANFQPVAWVTPHYMASPLDSKVFGRTFSRTLQRVMYVPESTMDARYGISQFFPYTIYKDIYGQWVYPENMGYFSPTDPMASARQIVAWAKRNLVLRDQWASFFYHPYIGNHPDGLNALGYAVDEIQKLGYEFYTLEGSK